MVVMFDYTSKQQFFLFNSSFRHFRKKLNASKSFLANLGEEWLLKHWFKFVDTKIISALMK